MFQRASTQTTCFVHRVHIKVLKEVRVTFLVESNKYYLLRTYLLCKCITTYPFNNAIIPIL